MAAVASTAAGALAGWPVRFGARLQRADHAVDLPLRLPQPFLDSLVEPSAERLLTGLQLLFPRRQLRSRLAELFALPCHQTTLVIERLHVTLDLRQMLVQLRFASRPMRSCLLDD